MQHTVQNAEEYCFVKYRRTAFFGDLDHLRLHRIGMPEIESLTMPDVEKVTVLQLRAYLNLYGMSNPTSHWYVPFTHAHPTQTIFRN